ncbi:signal recognition particle protein [Candidatus Profftia tarda]|nr:signal recognition particle protein [Candidatus Profftia tarda]
MFDNLSEKVSRALRNISGQGRITAENIKETLRELRIALLDADVALPVVVNFIDRVKKAALGREVNKNLTPSQSFLSIVKKEMTHAMGAVNTEINLVTQPPAVILIAGLQGVGKTTSVGKIGKFLKEKYTKKVLVVSSDVYRPAAIKQLETLAKEAEIDFFPSEITEKPIEIVKSALQFAKQKLYDVLIVDTAGRMHINVVMMNEIKQIYDTINPIETLFIVDAMTGQDAANAAKAFQEKIQLTGIVLTKVDGDIRGGAALSVRHITNIPIKFLGVGEKQQALEPFYPDRIASRILGMGDVLSLIEDIESKIDYAQTEKLAQKIKQGEGFNLNDFMCQLRQMSDMGGIHSILEKMPGIGQLPENLKNQIDNKLLIDMESIIKSMTLKERANPEIIKGSRKRRIAQGSGMQMQDINRLLKHFDNMRRLMKQMKTGSLPKKMIHGIEGIISKKFFGH